MDLSIFNLLMVVRIHILWSNELPCRISSNLAGRLFRHGDGCFGCTCDWKLYLESPLPIEVTDVVHSTQCFMSWCIWWIYFSYDFWRKCTIYFQWSNGFGVPGFSVTNANLKPGNYTMLDLQFDLIVWTSSYSIHGLILSSLIRLFIKTSLAMVWTMALHIFVPDSLESVSYLWDDGSKTACWIIWA